LRKSEDVSPKKDKKKEEASFNQKQEASVNQKSLKESIESAEKALDKHLGTMDKTDEIYGVVPKEFAGLHELPQSYLGGCEELAIIGFWDFDESLNCHKCERFCMVPYPMTRAIK
jgi:hypothetical protein